jgi:hypothetical protein
MSEPILINNLNDGIDVKSDPSAVSEGGLVDCIGFDLTQEGVLHSASGLADHDLISLLPVGSIQWFQIYYMGRAKYVLATTDLGLYSNGTLIDATFTGRFKGVVFLNNIFMVNGNKAVRFNGTTCYQWGITAPNTMPTIAATDYLSTVLDAFESVTTWTANQVSCTVSLEAAIYKEGAKSMKVNVAASTTGYSYKPITADGTLFSNGNVCTDSDYFRFWLYVDNFENLDNITLLIDIGDGTFKNDYFIYTLVSPGKDEVTQLLGFGASVNAITEDTTGSIFPEDLSPTTQYSDAKLGWTDSEPSYTTKTRTVTINKVTKQALVPSVVNDQTLNFWQKSDLFKMKSATWKEVKIPKNLFVQHGDISKGWDSIVSVKVEITTTSSGAVNAYFDGMKFVGGSDLIGSYWFMYSWGRMEDGSVIHQSAPSRDQLTKQFNIFGPVSFDRHPLLYSARPLSADTQVNCGVLSAIGGSLVDFWEMAVIEDNTTLTDTLYDIGDKFATRVISNKNNEPAPGGKNVILFRNKIWMVGDLNYPGVLRSSDILMDGTIAPEAWPTRNAYEMAESTGALLHVGVVNKQLVVKGESGEWLVKVLDPTDYLQVGADRVSSMGLLGQDAVINLESSNIYPSQNGFVESDGNSARIVLPEIQPLIDSNISSAKGVNAGLVNYFSYSTSAYGNRTAKIDLLRGKPRITNLIDCVFECLEYDKKANAVYGVFNGGVWRVDSGTINASISGNELYCYLKSRSYRRGGKVSWHRMEMRHNTNGVWFRVEFYIDDRLVVSTPFRSTTQTLSGFTFGPVSGYDFQFRILGNTTQPVTIYFPIRIR